MSKQFDRYRAHPWHGLPVGDEAPAVVETYIEITPFDAVKYEIDKATGYLRVDRPQGSSALPPCLYGLIPKTYCGDRVAAFTPGAEMGDEDPLDICVISEQAIEKSDVVVSARVLGGIQLLDGGEADDKIVAVLHNDTIWSAVKTLSELPQALVDRLHHYFATYKLVAGESVEVSIERHYEVDHALRVVEAACADYAASYGSGT